MRNPLHIKVPDRVARGELVQIRVKLNHPMESGWRKAQDGQSVPRALANLLVCEFNGEEVFRADLAEGTASDPYLSFYLRPEQSGTLHFLWTGEDKTRLERTARIEVT